MISFSIYMSIFFSLYTIDRSINHHLSHPHLIDSSLWFSTIMPTLVRLVISPDSMDLPSIISTCLFYFNSWTGIMWWQAKSWSINSMPVAPQSSSACVHISGLFTVSLLVITKCFPSIDSYNTSTLLTDRCEIPIYFKAFETKLVSINQSAILLSLT